jgi:acyl transferase domain-containing protein
MTHEPIAIVGIGCRFPGGADDPGSFWRLLVDGVDAIGPIPPERFDVGALYDPEPGAPGKIASPEGGFLADVDRFDAAFFGISPREAACMDPQQRLLLEVAWEALEDAGCVPAAIRGSRAGVFVGVWTSDYEDTMYRAVHDIDLYVTTGGGRYADSGRLSYVLDLQGPSMTVDTACSSSLVSVHLACQSLRSGECDLALAGGVNLILEPEITIGYSRSGILSQDGRCRFGDAAASGYVRSEGAGLLVLKPLARALADGDSIYAVVRGSAVNNDGGSSGLLVAPGSDGQAAMLRDAYRVAGVDPAAVGYVEAHGTGTRVGDAVELEALGRVLGAGRPLDTPCPVGSVKTNIGHTEAASGVAGLIKAALCLRHEAIPPSLHFDEPNPAIPWSSLPLRVQRETTSWPSLGVPRLVGVNSFGITGTNAHIVLEEAPEPAIAPASRTGEGPALVPISAHTREALREAAARHARVIREASLVPADVARSRAQPSP